MDHRWDRSLVDSRAARGERERYARARPERDADVERRDRASDRQRRFVNMSPWEIGASHYDQRDLYTRNARTDDAGYGRGPAIHPEVGSYAYHRELRADDHVVGGPSIYEREAWPWVNYEPERRERASSREDGSFWGRVKNEAHRALGAIGLRGHGAHVGSGPKNWQPSNERIHGQVCEALAAHGDLDATDIEVSVTDGEVTLSGTVPDRRSKRLAEDVAGGCVGVRDVHNRLSIRRDDDDNIAFTMPIRAF